jgi:hypothetical protein
MLPPLGFGANASRRPPALHPFDRRTSAHVEPLGRLARDAPDSTASTTRSRNSKEHGFGIDALQNSNQCHHIRLSKSSGESRFNSAEIRSSGSAGRSLDWSPAIQKDSFSPPASHFYISLTAVKIDVRAEMGNQTLTVDMITHFLKAHI